jgi:hypothetical protein
MVSQLRKLMLFRVLMGVGYTPSLPICYSTISDQFYDVYSDAYYDTGTP